MIGKRIITVFMLLLASLICYSKQGRVTGRVTDDRGKPVDQCMVKALGTNYATNSNKTGEFTLDYNTDSSNSLLFICAGYETQEVKIADDALWVILKHKVTRLDNVVVTASYSKGEMKQGVLGKKNLKQHGISTDVAGSENAIFLSADSTRHGLLQEVFYYITKDGLPRTNFRVHIYDIDTNFLPGRDLLDSTVIIHANEGDEWVKADLSSRRIPVGRGVFISMEWLSGSGNTPNLFTEKRYTDQWKFNSQVLGMTGGYNKRGGVGYDRAKRGNYEWHDFGNYPEHFEKHLNPMIYATYIYRKK